MDITFVRQADAKSEIVKGKEIKFIDLGDISNLSKSSLRILYECGKRPLYSFAGSTDFEGRITVVESPQHQPDCILCANEINSLQSASVLKEQISDVGIDIQTKESKALSKRLSSSTQKRLFKHLIQHELETLKSRGVQHLVIVSDISKLNTIYNMITNENLPDLENRSTCLWSIRNGQPSYTYDSQIADYVTSGLQDTRVVMEVNNPNCPEFLKKFQGKIKKPIDEYKLFYKIREQAKSK